MHDQMSGGEARPESVERQRRDQVDEEDLPPGHDLHEADAGAIPEEIVGLGVDCDLRDPVQGAE